MSKWEDSGNPFTKNYILRGDGFFISFNPDPSASMLGSIFGSDDGGPETALCYEGEYYILNGDYRDAYERLLPQGYDACKRFYDQQSAHADSSWSTPSQEVNQ